MSTLDANDEEAAVKEAQRDMANEQSGKKAAARDHAACAFSTTKLAVVVVEPPILSVWTRLAPSTW